MTEQWLEKYIEDFLTTLDRLGITHDTDPKRKGYISTDALYNYWIEQGVVEYDI